MQAKSGVAVITSRTNSAINLNTTRRAIGGDYRHLCFGIHSIHQTVLDFIDGFFLIYFLVNLLSITSYIN